MNTKAKFPATIRQAMLVTNYGEAQPENKLAFLIGYLCGSLACNDIAGRGKAALLRWSRNRSKEIDTLFQEFDATDIADLVERVKNIKN